MRSSENPSRGKWCRLDPNSVGNRHTQPAGGDDAVDVRGQPDNVVQHCSDRERQRNGTGRTTDRHLVTVSDALATSSLAVPARCGSPSIARPPSRFIRQLVSRNSPDSSEPELIMGLNTGLADDTPSPAR